MNPCSVPLGWLHLIGIWQLPLISAFPTQKKEIIVALAPAEIGAEWC